MIQTCFPLSAEGKLYDKQHFPLAKPKIDTFTAKRYDKVEPDAYLDVSSELAL